MRHSELQKEIETPLLLACAIENSTDSFGISGGGVEHPKPPLGTPLIRTSRYDSRHKTIRLCRNTALSS